MNQTVMQRMSLTKKQRSSTGTMMTIADPNTYRLHRHARETASWQSNLLNEWALPMLVFGSMGAITWAIRGTSGWGGMDGTIVPGMMWALLWYYLCLRKGIDARSVVLWLGLGLSLGGELGYGQYVSWIQGYFQYKDQILDVSEWTGHLWFGICGLGWAAPGCILLGWALSGDKSVKRWLMRLTIPFVFAYLGALLIQWRPGWFFPNHDLGIYVDVFAPELERTLGRTVYTNTLNFMVAAWWLGAMVVAALQRDRATLVMGVIVGLGFFVGFPLSALWCLGYTYAQGYVDWWKVWELNSGWNLGLLYVVAMYWAIRQVDKTHDPNGTPRKAPAPLDFWHEWFTDVGIVAGGALLIFANGGEYFPKKILVVVPCYIIVMLLSTWPPNGGYNLDGVAEQRKRVALIFTGFFLLFIMCHGLTDRLGIVTDLVTHEEVDQYDWPPMRVLLFIPMVVVLVAGTLYKLARALHGSWTGRPREGTPKLPIHMIDLMTFTGFVGATSILGSGMDGIKICVLYAVFLVFGIGAFTRLNRRLDAVDRRGGA